MPYNDSMQKIALCGYAGVGKSTYVRKNFPDYVEIALADPIKRALYAMGATKESLWGPSERRNDVFLTRTVREWLNLLGTELVRTRSPDHWVNLCLDEIDGFGTFDFPGVIVPDVRWPNEARILCRHGFTLLRLERPGHERRVFGETEEQDLSPWISETVIL